MRAWLLEQSQGQTGDPEQGPTPSDVVARLRRPGGKVHTHRAESVKTKTRATGDGDGDYVAAVVERVRKGRSSRTHRGGGRGGNPERAAGPILQQADNSRGGR